MPIFYLLLALLADSLGFLNCKWQHYRSICNTLYDAEVE